MCRIILGRVGNRQLFYKRTNLAKSKSVFSLVVGGNSAFWENAKFLLIHWVSVFGRIKRPNQTRPGSFANTLINRCVSCGTWELALGFRIDLIDKCFAEVLYNSSNKMPIGELLSHSLLSSHIFATRVLLKPHPIIIIVDYYRKYQSLDTPPRLTSQARLLHNLEGTNAEKGGSRKISSRAFFRRIGRCSSGNEREVETSRYY